MQLLVIVLSLLSERFLVHVRVHQRFNWFLTYSNALISVLPNRVSPGVVLGCLVCPVLILLMLGLYLVNGVLFGFFGFVAHFIIFYYCLGPVNPFYSAHDETSNECTKDDIENYFVQVNDELFAILFWYVVIGPWMIVAYRLFSKAQSLDVVRVQAMSVMRVLDWLPARFSALLYLLAGNFQSGIEQYYAYLFKSPETNAILLKKCGFLALNGDDTDAKTMRHAETLVEHAMIIFLVMLALGTLVARF
jgi:AmpE protein